MHVMNEDPAFQRALKIRSQVPNCTRMRLFPEACVIATAKENIFRNDTVHETVSETFTGYFPTHNITRNSTKCTCFRYSHLASVNMC